MNHHTVGIRAGDMIVIARPLRDTSWWNQWRAERACKREINHCWHPSGYVDWWCCSCSADTDGMPPQECKICTLSGV